MGDVTDLYGFHVKLNAEQEAERAECDKVSDSLQSSWMPFIESSTLPPDAKLKDMVRKGVPPTVRPWVWMESSGAAKKKQSFANNYFHIMVTASDTSRYLKAIEEDVRHTFPSHPWLQCEDGQAAMRKILAAYSVHNDKIAYCRGMNNLVGLMLVVLNRNEENAFWLLATLVEDILYPGTYDRNLEGCQVEMRALDELILQKLPKLHAHLNALECEMSIVATDWFLCLFCTSLPSETAARVWDALFKEGPKILFRVAIALIKMTEETTLGLRDAGEILIYIRSFASSMHNREKLMAMAFDGIGGLPMATIEKFRDAKAREVSEMMRARADGGEAAPVEGATPHEEGSELAQKMKEGFGKLGKLFGRG